MFTWIDGHLVLVALLSPVVSFWIVGMCNAWLARRYEQRGGAR